MGKKRKADPFAGAREILELAAAAADGGVTVEAFSHLAALAGGPFAASGQPCGAPGVANGLLRRWLASFVPPAGA